MQVIRFRNKFGMTAHLEPVVLNIYPIIKRLDEYQVALLKYYAIARELTPHPHLFYNSLLFVKSCDLSLKGRGQSFIFTPTSLLLLHQEVNLGEPSFSSRFCKDRNLCGNREDDRKLSICCVILQMDIYPWLPRFFLFLLYLSSLSQP